MLGGSHHPLVLAREARVDLARMGLESIMLRYITLVLAPKEGFKPPTHWLTASRSITELLGNIS